MAWAQCEYILPIFPIKFYTQYTPPTLICRGTDARMHGRKDTQKIFTQYSGISSCS